MAAPERAVATVLLLGWCAACATPRYAPCPVALPAGLPADAFTICRDVLRQRYGELAVADAAAFRLQSTWVPVQDPPGERRATVLRDDGADGPGLGVVVELRRIQVPWLGAPDWTSPRGDDAAERDLAAALQAALAPAATAVR